MNLNDIFNDVNIKTSFYEELKEIAPIRRKYGKRKIMWKRKIQMNRREWKKKDQQLVE